MATYSIKDLERLSGIKAHTLRMWEKRYEILRPQRSETNFRLYSDQDLKCLLNVSILNKNGYKISKIERLSDVERQRLVLEINTDDGVIAKSAYDQLLLHMLELNETGFNEVFQELIDSRGMENAFKGVIFPFLEQVGVLWLVGSIIPAQEHFISNLIRQKIIAAIDRIPYPKKNKVDVILFLPEQDLHEITLLFYQFYLKLNGYKTIYLGQSVPKEDVQSTINRFHPKYTVSSWIASASKDYIEDYFKFLNKAFKNKKDLPIHLCGGNQIKLYKNDLCDFLNYIKEPNKLEEFLEKK